MKERPILFTAPMVRALLVGTKTQTRRALTIQPGDGAKVSCARASLNRAMTKPVIAATWDVPAADGSMMCVCPYGVPGDRLWVRETFFSFGRWETRYSAKKGRDEWHFVDMTLESGRHYLYAADNANYAANLGANKGRGLYPGWWKRPAIHMPRAASRTTLEVTGVRVERLRAINEVDAIAEGAPWAACGAPQEGCHKAGFAQLWESINGPGSWDLNPWVWVIEFRRVAQGGAQ